jgi:hypothetical protein
LESCFYCHFSFCSFDFGTFVHNLQHLSQFEISTDRGIVFAIDIIHGLGSRQVEWIVPGEHLGCPTSSIRREGDSWCDEDCARVEEIIDDAVAKRGTQARFEVTELEVIMSILYEDGTVSWVDV